MKNFVRRYERHRWRFSTIEEFADWYNHRIHGSLWLKIGENPEEAFLRKAPTEALLGLFMEQIDRREGDGLK